MDVPRGRWECCKESGKEGTGSHTHLYCPLYSPRGKCWNLWNLAGISGEVRGQKRLWLFFQFATFSVARSKNNFRQRSRCCSRSCNLIWFRLLERNCRKHFYLKSAPDSSSLPPTNRKVVQYPLMASAWPQNLDIAFFKSFNHSFKIIVIFFKLVNIITCRVQGCIVFVRMWMLLLRLVTIYILDQISETIRNKSIIFHICHYLIKWAVSCDNAISFSYYKWV